jgi:phage FluMu protein Com
MASQQKVYAKVPFRYGPAGTNGEPVDRGQIITLLGLRNDSAMLHVNMVQPITTLKSDVRKCDSCGAEFITENFYYMHKKKPSCKTMQTDISKRETAEMIDADVSKVMVE